MNHSKTSNTEWLPPRPLIPADVAGAGGRVHLDAAVEGDVVLRVQARVAAVPVAAVVCRRRDEGGAVILVVVVRRGGGRREAPRRPELALRRRALFGGVTLKSDEALSNIYKKFFLP